ncbi:MAG TPA: MerR family DNA-binding protein [Pyrinomonadaceae bacterium]|jgi:DNA-binding transcriptional MerR regulator
MTRTAVKFGRHDATEIGRREPARPLRIGEVAARSGLSVEALRFYERRGLLGRPARTVGGYRAYDQGVLDRLAFIKRAQAVGFSLAEITEILSIRAEGRSPCHHVRALARHKLAELDERLRALRRYRRELAELLREWDERGAAEGEFCGLIEHSELHAADAPPVRRKKNKEGRKHEHKS